MESGKWKTKLLKRKARNIASEQHCENTIWNDSVNGERTAGNPSRAITGSTTRFLQSVLPAT